MFAIIAVATSCLLLFYFRNFLRIQWYVDKLPGSPKWRIVRAAYSYTGPTRDNLFEYVKDSSKGFKSIYRCWHGPWPSVHLLKPEYCETVLRSSTARGFYKVFEAWLGDGLLTIKPTLRWHRNRKLIVSAFHSKNLQDFLEVFNEKGCELAGRLSGLADGNEQNLYDLINRYTLDIICETLLGIDIGAMTNASEYVSAIETIAWLSMERLAKPWILHDFYYRRTKVGREYYAAVDVFNRFSENVLEDRKKNFQVDAGDGGVSGGQKRRALLDLLVEYSQDGNGFSDREIRNEINTMIAAGHNTVFSSLSWTLLLLGSHQEVQDKVRQEIGDVLQDSARVTSQHLRDLKYLERIFKESQRLFPSIPIVSRLLQQDVQLGKYLIPEGVMVILHLYKMYRDPGNFPEPETFDPDRFLPERSHDRHPYSFIPFSAGPRNCIGQQFSKMEVKVLLAYILRKYRVVALEWPEDLKVWMHDVSRPQGSVRVVLEKLTP